jgi:PAS domain S-box-containing protein
MPEKPTYDELQQRILELEQAESERKKAQKALRENEQFMTSVFESIQDGISILNPDLSIRYVNNIMKTWYAEKLPLEGQKCYACYQNLSEPCSGCPTLRSLESGKTEMQIVQGAPGSEVEWIELYSYPIKDNETGKITGIVEFVRDITQRMQATEALRESEEKYRDLAASLPQVVFETDLLGNLTFVNQNAFDLFGYTQEDFNNGLNALQMLDPNEQDRALTNIQAIIDGEIIDSEEYTALKKDGTAFPILIHAQRFMRGDQVVGLRGLIIDLRDMKNLESDLRRRARAMDQSKETIIITDTSGLITYVNPAFELTSGYSQAEALGQNPNILQSGRHDDGFYKNLWQTISSGKTWKGHLINQTKKGKQYTEEATISPVFSDKGEIVNYVAVKRDISDKIRLEAQLQQAQKMEAIGNLAGGIAHDFNNILSPIFGYTEMLMLDAPPDSQLHQGLMQILAGAKTARDLIKQILTFSRQSEHEKKPLKVHRIVQEALKLVRSSLPTTIDIKENISNDCGLILGDPTQIHQIIMNLCTNAYHAMETTGGNIRVSLNTVQLSDLETRESDIAPGTYVRLTVADTGIGIGPDYMDRIFDPYFTTKDSDKGTGMGLAVVHGIVKNHNGYIHADSEIGQGTLFQIDLPVIEEFQVAPEAELPRLEKGHEHILVVDDQKDVADIERQMLERLGYEVSTRTSSIEALEAFRLNPDSFDLVMTDMTMPNMTGDMLAREILKIRPDIRIILCTGFSERISENKSASMGFKGFLMKPVIISELSNMVRKILDQ